MFRGGPFVSSGQPNQVKFAGNVNKLNPKGGGAKETPTRGEWPNYRHQAQNLREYTPPKSILVERRNCTYSLR